MKETIRKVCPNCHEECNIRRKSYPCYVEENIYFSFKYSEVDYDVEEPEYSSDDIHPTDYFCSECDYRFNEKDVMDIYNKEMVYEKEK